MLLLFLSAELAADLDKQTAEFIREERRRNRSLPEKKDRPTWRFFVERASADHFRRMFRMPLAQFEELCDDTSNVVTQEVFCPAAFLPN